MVVPGGGRSLMIEVPLHKSAGRILPTRVPKTPTVFPEISRRLFVNHLHTASCVLEYSCMLEYAFLSDRPSRRLMAPIQGRFRPTCTERTTTFQKCTVVPGRARIEDHRLCASLNSRLGVIKKKISGSNAALHLRCMFCQGACCLVEISVHATGVPRSQEIDPP